MLPDPVEFMAASGEEFLLEPVSVLPSSVAESKVVLAPIRDRFPLVEGREAVWFPSGGASFIVVVLVASKIG